MASEPDPLEPKIIQAAKRKNSAYLGKLLCSLYEESGPPSHRSFVYKAQNAHALIISIARAIVDHGDGALFTDLFIKCKNQNVANLNAGEGMNILDYARKKDKDALAYVIETCGGEPAPRHSAGLCLVKGSNPVADFQAAAQIGDGVAYLQELAARAGMTNKDREAVLSNALMTSAIRDDVEIGRSALALFGAAANPEIIDMAMQRAIETESYELAGLIRSHSTPIL